MSARRAGEDRSRDGRRAITPLSIGDEWFMACHAPDKGRPGSCETYTRMSNVVFKVVFESYPVPNAHDPASSARALTAEAAQRLSRSG